jgi:hypothetical protein
VVFPGGPDGLAGLARGTAGLAGAAGFQAVDLHVTSVRPGYSPDLDTN